MSIAQILRHARVPSIAFPSCEGYIVLSDEYPPFPAAEPCDRLPSCSPGGRVILKLTSLEILHILQPGMGEKEGKRPVIAILANFPVWVARKEVAPANRHYAVWLAALFEGFASGECPFEIHWLTLTREKRWPKRFEAGGQYFHVLPRLPRRLGIYTRFLWDRLTLLREMRRIQPDLAHSWGSEDCYGLANRMFRGKRLHSVQGSLKKYCELAPFDAYTRKLASWEGGVWSDIGLLTTESPWAAQAVLETAPDAHPVLWEYAVEKSFFEKTRVMASKPTCLYAGSDSAVKNVKFLLEVFSRPELSSVHLVLAGVSAEKHPGLPPNITCLGRVNRREMASILSQAWALVHPSLADTGPTIVKEARVMRIPVILSSRCGSAQHVVEGCSGFVLDPHDAEGWSKAILSVMQSPERALSMGEYDSDNCRRRLSAEVMVHNILELYSGILGMGDHWQATRQRFLTEFAHNEA